MHERNRNRSFANGRRDALDVTAPDVAGSEYAAQARFEQMRRPRERPASRREVVAGDVASRLHEALRVERHASSEPRGVRDGAGHQEDVPDVVPFDGALRVPPLDGLEMAIAVERHNLGTRV